MKKKNKPTISLEINNGDIIRFDNDKCRDWVAIHYSRITDIGGYERYNKNIKDHTGFYLFGMCLGEGDALTNEPYCKCAGMLKRGMFANIQIVGNVQNKNDYLQYKRHERID